MSSVRRHTKGPPTRMIVPTFLTVTLCFVTITYVSHKRAISAFPPEVISSDAILLPIRRNRTTRMEAFVEEFRESRNESNRVIIHADSMWFESGGPEALVQLALAFHSFLPNSTYLGLWKEQSLRIGQRFIEEYPLITNLRMIQRKDFANGDVLIVPERVECDKSWLQQTGVIMYIWVLRSKNKRWHRTNQQQGCDIVAHNYRYHDLYDNPGPQTNPHLLLRPYVSPSLVINAPRTFDPRPGRIVWFNPEVRDDIVGEAQRICEATQLKCTAKKVDGFKRHELPAAYQQGTVVFETCMRGSERVVLEAAIHGNIFVTTNCDCAKDARDFPIPQRNILPNGENLTASLAEALERIFQNYESEWNDYEAMRKLYRDDLCHDSLVEEAKSFLYEIHRSG